MQLSNKPDKLVLPFAASGAKNTIPANSQIGIVAGKASLTDGFPPLTRTPLSAGGVPPSGLDMNGIIYELSAVIRWANAGGGYPFDSTFATDTNVGGYPKGSRIMRADGAGYWYNTTDNNVTDPETSGAAAAGWVPDFTTGVAAVTMTSANVTLTPSQYGKPIIVISGALTANLNLIFPNITGQWDVINNTTGGFSITAKTQTGNGPALSHNVDQLFGDGANIYAANSFLQSGAGAVVRSMNDKAKEIVSVKDFGAVGDGVSDDTTKIQAAADYLAGRSYGSAQGGRLRFPAGLYKITSPITIIDEMVIEGDGNESTKIFTDDGVIFNVTSAGVRFQDLFLSGPSGISSAGIRFTNGNNCVVERCTFQNQTAGIELNSSYAVEVIGCIFDVCYTYGIRANTSCHNLSVERCGFFTCGVTGGGHGISLEVASDNIRIVGNDFEYCYVNMRLNNCTAIEITGNYCEYQAVRSFDLDGTCYGVKIEHNWIALGQGSGATEIIKNVVGGSFKRNTIYNQSIDFDHTLLQSFTIGVNRKTGTGTLETAPWIPPTLLNSWAQQANYTPVGYTKDEDGWVYLRGGLVGGVVPNTLFVLPVGYRPSAIAVFGTEGSNGACRIAINPDGTVVPSVAGGNNPFLDGIFFKVI